MFLGATLLLAIVLRTLVVMPRSIPSESMMPGLLPGDYVLVWKYPYGWSRFSLPVPLPAPAGRLFGRLPARGDVVVFRGPGKARADYIKRVVGLPGDRVAMRAGRIVLDGHAVPAYRVADFTTPIDAATHCVGAGSDGRDGALCRWPRYRETLPDGRAWTVIDQGPGDGDDTTAVTVPPGHLFVLGDNRDVSADSRYPPGPIGGVGMVPLDALEGRAGPVVFSTGGASGGLLAWLHGLRLARIGARP